MTQTNRCPKCGSAVPPTDAPAGLCPKCLLLGAGESDGASSPASPRRFVPPAVEDLAGQIPGYEIESLIGRGGMGAVYKARQRELDRPAAIKLLPRELGDDPAFAERFRREAQVMAKLDHPNIVRIYDFGQSGGGHFYFAMEYVDGVDLQRLIRSGEVAEAQALDVVRQICEALQYAHDQGFVHRDIKPANIFINAAGQVKVGDFGIARVLGAGAGDDDPTLLLTGSGQAIGTPNYAAPEQLSGGAVDHRADIYSLGVMLYEMLTGEIPRGAFDPPSQKVRVDVRLDEVVIRAMRSEPERRYQRAAEVRADVESITQTPPPPPPPAESSATPAGAASPPPSPPGGSPPKRKKNGCLLAVLIAACLGIPAFGIMLFVPWCTYQRAGHGGERHRISVTGSPDFVPSKISHQLIEEAWNAWHADNEAGARNALHQALQSGSSDHHVLAQSTLLYWELGDAELAQHYGKNTPRWPALRPDLQKGRRHRRPRRRTRRVAPPSAKPFPPGWRGRNPPARARFRRPGGGNPRKR
ncbi:MAG: serine/threonine-protein kinase [Verrucomicrobiales bacterium]